MTERDQHDPSTDAEMHTSSSAAEPAAARALNQSMLWSVYYHAFHQRTLRGSVLRDGHPFAPIPLDQAVGVVRASQDRRARERQRRVLLRLAVAGFANEARWELLRKQAERARDSEWLQRLDSVRREVHRLAEQLGVDAVELGATPVHRVRKMLQQQLLLIDPGCVPSEPSLVACQVPVFNDVPRPMTTVVASAVLPKTPIELARTFDPRSWGTCFDHFDTERKREFDSTKGEYPRFFPDYDPIGEPWNPSDAPHLFWERITLQGGAQTNIFENILEVTSFSVDPSHAKLCFRWHEGWKMVIPGLGLDITECVDIDEGHLEATLLPAGGGVVMSRVELVKRLRFIDLDSQGGTSPLGFDPGEILNYLAPACMCMWLEDLTQGAVCCGV